MILLGSLIAFALVYLGASVALSVLLAWPVVALEGRLTRLGPWVARRASAGALLLPPLLALVLVAALAGDSAHALWTGDDHCFDHDHHPHLCVRHGASWALQPWALALVVAAATYVLTRAALSVWAHLQAQGAANRLRAVGRAIGHRCYLVPSQERFAFTAGLFSPAVLLSSAAWDALTPEEREAVVAHELGHVAHGDLWRRAALGFVASLGAPYLTSRLLAIWTLASEHLCDRRAVQAVGRASTVAGAMLALVRSAPPPLAPAGALFVAASHVPSRIQAVLAEGPDGARAARHLNWALFAATAAVVAGCVRFAEPLHHALETVLG